jgi:D-glycero-D-manno-heptose 1,7-bisphosphate phosphatase
MEHRYTGFVNVQMRKSGLPGHQLRPALFLDRDGVINVDHGYVHRIDQFEFLPGIFDLVRFAVCELDWPVIVVTNQAGIGRGLFDENSFEALTLWMCERFAREGAPLTKIYYCPFHPEHGIGEYRKDHPWRKPNPGMVLKAQSDFDLDIAGSVLIGDRLTDIQCAEAAGIGFSIMICPDSRQRPVLPTVPVHDLAQALAFMRARFASSAST